MEDVEAELRLPHIQNSQSRGFAALTCIANCPSDSVRWRRLLNIVQCGPCPLCHPRAGWRQVLDFHHRELGSPINKLSQQPSARAGRRRAMTPRCTLCGGQVLPALVVSRKKAPDEAASTN